MGEPIVLQRYGKALAKRTLANTENLVFAKRGHYGGTWAHRRVGLKCAAWLSKEFEIWIQDIVEEHINENLVHQPSLPRVPGRLYGSLGAPAGTSLDREGF